MRLPPALRQRFSREPPQARDRARPLRPNLVQIQRVRALARDDDEIDAGREEVAPEPEALPAEALGPVAGHGVAHSPRRDDAEARGTRASARRGPLRSRHEEHEVSGLHAPAEALDALEVASPAHAPVAIEGRPGGHRGGGREREQRSYFL